jgi:hypothetical protein
MVFLALGGAFGVCAVFALVGARNAARWLDRRRFWQLLAIGIALLISSGIALWAGTRYPNALLSHGFGPDWECATDIGGHTVCLRKPAPPVPSSEDEAPRNGCDAV